VQGGQQALRGAVHVRDEARLVQACELGLNERGRGVVSTEPAGCQNAWDESLAQAA